MKTFNEKDLITWANRDKAVIGKEYYFTNRVEDLKDLIKDRETHTLCRIDNNYITQPFAVNLRCMTYACILPIDKVIDEPEKKYRACRTVQELYELVTNLKSKMSEEECVHELLGTTIHFKDKYQNEFYVLITQIRIIDDEYLIGLNGAMFSFNELFKNYEIEINGEWKPFGVLEK